MKTIILLVAALVSATVQAAKFDFPLHQTVVEVDSPYDHQTHYLLVGDPIEKALALLGLPYETVVYRGNKKLPTLYAHKFNHRGRTYQIVVPQGSNEIIAIDSVF